MQANKRRWSRLSFQIKVTIGADSNTEIWMFCRTKLRASYFAGTLYKYGYKNVYLVDGGLVAWIEKGYPLVNEHLGEIKVTRYDKRLKEEYSFRKDADHQWVEIT